MLTSPLECNEASFPKDSDLVHAPQNDLAPLRPVNRAQQTDEFSKKSTLGWLRSNLMISSGTKKSYRNERSPFVCGCERYESRLGTMNESRIDGEFFEHMMPASFLTIDQKIHTMRILAAALGRKGL